MSNTPPIISCKKRYNVLHVKGVGLSNMER